AERGQKAGEADRESSRIYYYHCDQIGAPQELTDADGRIVWAARYKVWGEIEHLRVRKTGTDDRLASVTGSQRLALADGAIQSLDLVEQPLRFQGQYADGETGLHYNRFRYYDPVVGRFIHQDPIGLLGGVNLFNFAKNPGVWIDPLGLAKYVIIGEGKNSVEAYAQEMREKSPCDNFITIKDEWREINSQALKDARPAPLFSKEWEQKAVAGNAKWVREHVAGGSLFIDIGTDSSKNRSPFYEAERKAIKRAGGKLFSGNRCAISRARSKAPESHRPPRKGRY
ncbi:RHS repeat domain-containing protein, partial [Sphingomonas sp. NCPPB 2930]